ncbi:hypothetical protein ABZY09_32055 [Streptomyces sp. NPDC002928]|uniref:hypothetical protein n=1 Tax=Streptomyces sp. NPDC002928 TaxID=3154440 RepID=UPI0033AA4CC8
MIRSGAGDRGPVTAPTAVSRSLALSARSVSSKATIAALTALWELPAGLAGPRTALALAGLLLLATPLLLPRRNPARQGRRLTGTRSPAG